MGISNLLNNKKVAVSVAVVVVGIAVYLLYGSSGKADSGKVFFTVDDGTTFFAADAKLVPPCMIDGKAAVFAYVFRCPTCGKKFVGNMGRYKAGRAEAPGNRLLARPGMDPGSRPEIVAGSGTKDLEMKRPGEPETAWKGPGSMVNPAALRKEAASGANLIHCPDHRDVVAEPIMP